MTLKRWYINFEVVRLLVGFALDLALGLGAKSCSCVVWLGTVEVFPFYRVSKPSRTAPSCVCCPPRAPSRPLLARRKGHGGGGRTYTPTANNCWAIQLLPFRGPSPFLARQPAAGHTVPAACQISA